MQKPTPSPLVIPNAPKDGPDISKEQNPKTKIPRNSSQPSMGRNGTVVPKRGSVPNFERRMSRIEIMSNLKVGRRAYVFNVNLPPPKFEWLWELLS